MKNAGLHENVCACSKLYFRTSVLHRSPTITDDYQRSSAFTQRSSGAIPATTDDYQRFLKHWQTLTRTLWCDGAFTEALQQRKPNVTTQRAIKLSRFHGRPSRAGDPTVIEWIDEVDIYCQQCHVSDTEKAQVVFNHLGGLARDEIKCNPGVKGDYKALVKLLHRHFGAGETVQSLQNTLYERNQNEEESLMDFSRALIRLYDRIIEVASESEKEALKGLKDKVLISQFVAGARSQSVRLELRRLELAGAEQTFSNVRDSALDLFKDIEKTKMKRGQVRQVRAGSTEELEEEDDYWGGTECQEVRVDGLIARNSSESRMQQLLQNQQEMLKCLRDQQGQIAKQQ